MAVVMGINRLNELLRQASQAGCGMAWVESGALVAGPAIGQPQFVIDFADEALTQVGLNVSERGERARPVGEGRGRTQDQGGRPSSPNDFHALGQAGGRRTGNFALILEDKLYPAKSQRELLRVALQVVERARPGTLDKLSAEKGRTKRPVARRRELLYEDPKLSKYADEIEGGWWIATNNSYPEVEKFIRRAGFHAGLHVEVRRSP